MLTINKQRSFNLNRRHYLYGGVGVAICTVGVTLAVVGANSLHEQYAAATPTKTAKAADSTEPRQGSQPAETPAADSYNADAAAGATSSTKKTTTTSSGSTGSQSMTSPSPSPSDTPTPTPSDSPSPSPDPTPTPDPSPSPDPDPAP